MWGSFVSRAEDVCADMAVELAKVGANYFKNLVNFAALGIFVNFAALGISNLLQKVI